MAQKMRKIPEDLQKAIQEDYDYDISTVDPTDPGADKRRMVVGIGIQFQLLTLQRTLVATFTNDLLPQLKEQLQAFKSLAKASNDLTSKLDDAVSELAKAAKMAQATWRATRTMAVATLLLAIGTIGVACGTIWLAWETHAMRVTEQHQIR